MGRHPPSTSVRTRCVPMNPFAPVTANDSRQDRSNIINKSRGLCGQKFPIPLNRSHQSVFEIELRAPAEHRASFARIEILMEDFVVRFASYIEVQIVAVRNAQDQPRQLEDRHLNLVTEVKRLPGQFPMRSQLLG